MIEITSEYVSAVREQEHLIASEKLGGNIVKEEFHKGALFGLKLAAQVLCAPKQEESPATGEHSGGPGTGNTQSAEIAALSARVEALEKLCSGARLNLHKVLGGNIAHL